MTAIADLMPPLTIADAKAVLLPFVGKKETKVTDWYPGAVLRTMLELEADVQSDAGGVTMPGILSQGYHYTAEDESLTDVAHAQWETDRDEATFAQQTVTFQCEAGRGPYAVVVERFMGKATDGLIYTVIAGAGTLVGGGTITVEMQALTPGQARGLVAAPVSDLPGVSVQSAAIRVLAGIPQYGHDGETNEALRARCDARLPDVDATYDDERVIQWIKEAVTTTSRYRFDADPVNPGGVIVTVAGPGGAIPGGDVTTAQDYVDELLDITDFVTVQNASNATVNAGGTVYVARARAAAIKKAANDAWVAYLAKANIGGEVFLSQLNKAVMDAGAINFTGRQLNGVGDDFVLAATEVPVAGGDLATQLDWIEI